jgi:hypothetical protein
MATFTHSLQGSTDTTIISTDKLQFAGGAFDDPITVNEYNDSTHVKDVGNADKSSANTPNNVKFISQSGGTGGDSQADWGGGTEDLDQIQNSEATLKINFSHGTAVAISEAKIYAYDGSTVTVAPTDIDVRMAEVGDTNWTEAEGQASACTLADKTAATSHDFYVAVSMSPTSVGTKTGKYRVELSYS